MVRLVDLPDITSTICCRRTYIARKEINYPKMLPDMVTVMEKLSASQENLLFTQLIIANLCASSLFSLHRQNYPSASNI